MRLMYCIGCPAPAFGLAALLPGGAASAATFTLSEIFVNPPGADNGQESIEIRGPAGASLANYWLLALEGDGTFAGTVDTRVNLGAMSAGANGLLLIRDAATVLQPPPAAGTSVVVMDFNPDFENGAITFIIAKFPAATPPPVVGTDLDSDNDGTLNVGALAAATEIDAVSYKDGAAGGAEYADDLGGAALGTPMGTDGRTMITPDVLYRIYSPNGGPCTWAGGDMASSQSAPGPYSIDAVRRFGFAPAGITGAVSVSLGNGNTAAADADGDGIGDPCDDGGTKGPDADLDGDGDVDGLDLGALLGSWGPAGCPADLDGNGVVNGLDLATMLGVWNP